MQAGIRPAARPGRFRGRGLGVFSHPLPLAIGASPVSAMGLLRLPRAGSGLPLPPCACWTLQSAGSVDFRVCSACPRIMGVRGRCEGGCACALPHPFRLGEGLHEEGLEYDSNSYQTNTKTTAAQEQRESLHVAGPLEGCVGLGESPSRAWSHRCGGQSA